MISEYLINTLNGRYKKVLKKIPHQIILTPICHDILENNVPRINIVWVHVKKLIYKTGGLND